MPAAAMRSATDPVDEARLSRSCACPAHGWMRAAVAAIRETRAPVASGSRWWRAPRTGRYPAAADRAAVPTARMSTGWTKLGRARRRVRGARVDRGRAVGTTVGAPIAAGGADRWTIMVAGSGGRHVRALATHFGRPEGPAVAAAAGGDGRAHVAPMLARGSSLATGLALARLGWVAGSGCCAGYSRCLLRLCPSASNDVSALAFGRCPPVDRYLVGAMDPCPGGQEQ